MSIEGLRELWVRTIRKNRYDLLEARVRRVGPLLDAQCPIAFVGTALLTMVGIGPLELAKDASRFRTSIENGWRTIQARGLSETEWKAVGRELETEMVEEEKFWTVTVPESLRDIKKKVDELAALGFHYSQTQGLARTRNALARGRGITTRPPLQTRGTAFLSYMTAKQKDAVRQTPASNDFYDARHLQHLVWPSFLATVDFRLIATVEKCCPKQRPWVRAPVELAQDRVATCEPWGKPAMRAFEAFSRSPVDDVRVRQEAWREALPRQDRAERA